jgi:hypothetical protein
MDGYNNTFNYISLFRINLERLAFRYRTSNVFPPDKGKIRGEYVFYDVKYLFS